MGRRGRKAAIYQQAGEPTAAREALERKWFHRMTDDPSLAMHVTAAGAHHEPFHRWYHLRQGFSPELVRLFLLETFGGDPPDSPAPVLDLFSGSGTVVVECARRRIPAIGVEASAALAFLSNVKSQRTWIDPPETVDATQWLLIADRFTEPLHRAALMCAVAKQHTSDGEPLKNQLPLHILLDEMLQAIREDLRSPLPLVNQVMQGDARRMTDVADESVAAVLTSPPYLSRYDYASVTRPYELVYQYWYGGSLVDERRKAQLPASPRAIGGRSTAEGEPTSAVREACAILKTEHSRLASLVVNYFADMTLVIQELQRVTRPHAPIWLVLGGARLKNVYVPSDLIVAEIAEHAGLQVEDVFVARYLIDRGRKLGTLRNVAPRETVLKLRKP